MKHIYKAIAICLLTMPLSMAAYAAEHDMSGMGQHEGMKGMSEMGKHDGMKGMPGMGMHDGMEGTGTHDGMPGMGMMSPEHLKEKQAHILLMHDLSNKILAEKDPKKQQQLKDQQLDLMKAHMMKMMEKQHKMKMSH